MRKSFTRFLSLFILFSIFSLFAVAVAPVVSTWGPGNPGLNVAHQGNLHIVTLTMTFDQAVQPGSGTGIIAVSENSGVQRDPIQINSNNSVNAVTGSKVTIAGKVVTLEFHYGAASTYDLLEGTTYQITVTGDALRLKDAPDAPANYFAGVSLGSWPITIADETKPEVAKVAGVSQFTPRDEATTAVLGNDLTVLFSEPVALGTGNIGLYTSAGDLVEMFTLPSANVSIVGGNTLTINPTNNLLEFQKYYVRIASTCIKDISTNANGYVGINDNGTWNFQAQDVTAPTANLTAGVAVTHINVQKLDKPTLTFVDNVQTNTYFPGTLVLQKAAPLAALTVGENVTGRFAMTENAAPYATFTATYKGNNVVEFATTVANGWTSNAVYVISYTGGVSQFADNQGNLNIGATNYTFTAGDLLPPTFTAFAAVPATTSADLLNSTKLYLSASMTDAASSLTPPGVPVTVKYLVVPAGATVTLQNVIDNGIVLPRKVVAGVTSDVDHELTVSQTNAGVTFESNTLYDVYYIATDIATVPNTSTSTAVKVLNVRTNDIKNPVATVTTVAKGGAPALTIAPAGSVTNVDKDGVITITFDEPVAVSGGDVTVKYNSSGSTWVTLTEGLLNDYTLSALDVTRKILTITPVHRDLFGNGWKSLSNYQVNIIANKINDDLVFNGKTGSNNYAVAATYTFSTEDFEGPVPSFKASSSATALQGRTDVAKGDNIIVTFTEAPYDEFGVLLTNTNIKNYITVRKGGLGVAPNVNVGNTDITSVVDMTISGNVVTINPNSDFDSETWYGVWVSTLIKDALGSKLNLYKDNLTTIAGTSEFAQFKAIDSVSPLITFSTRDDANLLTKGLVDVPVTVKPLIYLSELVKATVAGVPAGVAFSNADRNQIRSLIQLRKNNAFGDLINFNIVDVDPAPVFYGYASGTVILIDPIDFPSTYNFDGSSTYYVSITGVQDGVGNATSGSATFTTISTANLVTQNVSPAINATQVNLVGNVVITFDRNVVKTAGPATLLLDAPPIGAGGPDVSVDVSTANALVTGSGTATITIPYPALAANTDYVITLTGGAFTAANNGKPSDAITGVAQKFHSKDSQGPRVDLTPAAGGTPMGLASSPIKNAKLTLTFDEEVFLGSGIIYIRKAEFGVATTVATIDLSSANFTWANVAHTILNVNIPVTLEYGTKYIVEIPATAFKDKYNNDWEWMNGTNVYGNRAVVASAFLGAYVTGTSTWDFETVADAPITFDLPNCVPKQNGHTVDIATGLTIAFSEPVTVNSGIHMLTVFRSDLPGSPQTFDISSTPLTWNADFTKATIAGSLVNDLVANKNYYINIDAGAFKSIENGAQLSPALTSTVATQWFFTTTDATLPTILSITYDPADDGTQVGLGANIIVTFSEPVTPNAAGWATSVTLDNGAALVNGSFTYSGNTLTINPPANLIKSTLYTLTFAADIKDASTNVLAAAPVLKTFTTEDVDKPVITVNTAVAPYSPTKVKASITATDFTDPAGTNDIRIYYLITADNLYSAATITSAIVKANNIFVDVANGVNKQIEITGLNEKAPYDIWFVAVDKSKNLNETLPIKVDETLVNCATTDVTAPTISLLTPLNGNQFVSYGGAGAQFKIKWSEQIALSGNGANAIIRKKSDNTLVATVAQGAMSVVNSGTGFTNNQVNFTVAGLADVTEYYVELENGLVRDVYNSTVGASVPNNLTNEVFIGNTNWAFKTADERKPLLITNILPSAGAVRLTPANDAVAVPVGVSNPLVMVFDEDIQKNITTASWIRIYRVGTAAAFEVIPVSGADVVVGADKRTVTISRHNTYTSEFDYFVVVDNNAFFDYAQPVSNYYAGIAIQAAGGTPTDVTVGNVAAELWNYKTADITAPVVTWNPNGTTVVNSLVQGAIVEMFVNEDLFNGATPPVSINTNDLKAQFTVVDKNGAIVPATAIYNSGTDKVVITLPANMSSNNTYTVTYTSIASIADAAGNAVPTSSVTFNTEDRNSPVVTISAAPMNAASPSQILVGAKFKVTFDKLVLKDGPEGDSNVAPTAADLKDVNYLTVNGVAFTGTVNVINPGLEYELVPSANLAGQTSYTFIWTANKLAAQTVKDNLYFPNGNALDRTLAQRTFAFTTEDVSNPTKTLLNPVHVAAPATATIINANDKLTISFNELVQADDSKGKITIRYSNGQIFDEILPSACNYSDIVGPDFDVVITPNKNFDPFREYYVEIPAGAITDKSFNKNPYAGFLGNTTWRFRTDDGERPTVAIYNPANGSTGIALNANLVLTFSENIRITGANAGKQLVIYFNNGDTPDGNAIETITLPSAKVTITGSNLADPSKTSDVLTIDPATSFSFSAPGQYYVRIDEGFVSDFSSANAGAGNSYAGIHNNDTWKFNIADPTEPKLIAVSPFTPANSATGVGKSLSGVSMIFDRDIMAGAGSIKLFQYNYNALTFNETTKLIETISASSASINHTTNTVTFDFPGTLTTPLLDNTVYYILADNGSFTNTTVTHNWWAGISNPFTWRFTTGDNSAPTVVATLGAGVSALATPNVFDVTLTFNEAVTGVNATNVTVTGGTVALTTVSTSVYKATITALDLAAVKLSLSAGIKDLANNLFVAQDFNYKVADNNAPTLVATPNGGAIATNIFTVNLVFSEPVVVPEGAITVNNGATVVVSGTGATYQAIVTAQSGSVVTMSFANTIVDIINAVTNPVPHPFVGLPITFTVTGDKLAPVVTGLTPPDGTGVTPETGILRNPTLGIKFSEAVVLGTAGAKVKVYKQDVSNNNTLVSQTTINASMLSADGMTLTVPVIDPLTDNTDYVVLVDAGIVKSTFGVNFGGINLPTDWNLRTGDNTAPILTITDNAVNDLKTKNDILVTLQFNEAVWGVASAVTVTGASATPVITGVDGDMVYTVAIKAVDLADVSLTVANTVADKFLRNKLTLAQTVNFKVGDNTKPTVVVTGTVVANTVTATLTFNENVFGVASAITATGTTGAPVVAGADGGMVYTVTMNALDGASVTVKSDNTIADASGNKMDAATYGPFNVGDNTAPLATVDPASGSTNMKNNFTVKVAFNESVVVPDGAITVEGGAYVVTAPVSGNTYSVAITAVDGATVTLKVSNAVKDASGNVFVAQAYTYKVGDNTAPTAIVSPVTGTTGLTNTFMVDVTFNETVTVPEGAISVSDNAKATVKVPVSGNTYTVTITAADAAVVTLNVSSAIKDASNNAFVAKAYTYTVGDNTKPFIVDGGFSPADGDVNVKGSPISLKLTFNENVFAGSSAAEIKVYEQTVSSTNKLVFSTSVTAAMISANVVTIPVTYTLLDNTAYTVTVADGIVKDASNNVFATGFTDPTRWNFSTGDNTAPTVVSVDPSTATAAKQSFDVTITFSEAVVNVNNSTVTVDKGTVVVVPVGLTGTVYKATITAADGDVVKLSIGTGIKDASERNALAAAVVKTYTIGDNTAPTLVVTAPVAPVAKTFTVGLKFNEAVSGVNANTITVTNGTLSSVTGSGAEYTLTITGAEKAVVGIAIPNTIADLAGNKFAGKALEYTIGDFTAPIVTAEPATGDNLKKNFSVVLTFSEDAIVKVGDITATGGTIVVNPIVGNVCKVDVTAADMSTVVLSVASTVADAAGNKIAGTTSFTYKVGDNTAPTLTITGPAAPIETTFIVSFKFSEIVTGFTKAALTVTNGTIKQVVGSGTDYLVSISAEEKAVVKVAVSNAIVDANGNKFAGKEATFTVGDFSAPKVTVTPIVPPVTTVFTIDLKFDEPVTGLLLGGTAVTVTNGKIVDITGKNDTYKITVSGKEMTTVKVTLTSSIADLAGNTFAGLDLNYSIGDFTAPLLNSMSPTIDDVLANNHPTFKMTFSENVKLGAGGKLYVYKINTSSPALTIPITDAMIFGKVVTVDYTATTGLDKNARYYVLVDPTAITDIAGNAFDGVSDAAAWTFKTGAVFVTKIDPNSSLEFKVYPNPFVDFVNVDNASQLSKVVVTNIAGQVVKEVVTPTDRIQLNELRSGIYFMSLYNSDDVIVKTAKIVKR